MTKAPSFTAWVTVALMVLLFGAGAFNYTGFASAQVVYNLLIDNAFLLVIAVGMSFVILSGGIDLSVGSVLALSTMVAAWLLQVAHWPPLLVMLVVLIGGAAFGALMGLLIHRFQLQPFIVTLGGGSLTGGKFNLTGSLIGALIIQTLTSTIYSLGVPPEVNMVVKAVVVFAVCISQSSALKSKVRAA